MTPLSEGEDGVSRRTRDEDIGWGPGGGWKSMRSAEEGLGGNKTAIQVAARGHSVKKNVTVI